MIGAYGNDDAGLDSGSVYVFTRTGSTWSQQAKLTASDAAAGDWFGRSVAMSGDTAVIGAQYSDDSAGSAYVYARLEWRVVQQAKLLANDARAGDLFGFSVAVSSDTAVIGSPHSDDVGSESGSVYVYVRVDDVWSQQAKLSANDATANDFFGISVSVSGNSAVFGAYGNEDAGTNSGSAYIVDLQRSADYGDAPAPYPTLQANAGAAHGYAAGSIWDRPLIWSQMVSRVSRPMPTIWRISLMKMESGTWGVVEWRSPEDSNAVMPPRIWLCWW